MDVRRSSGRAPRNPVIRRLQRKPMQPKLRPYNPGTCSQRANVLQSLASAEVYDTLKRSITSGSPCLKPVPVSSLNGKPGFRAKYHHDVDATTILLADNRSMAEKISLDESGSVVLNGQSPYPIIKEDTEIKDYLDDEALATLLNIGRLTQHFYGCPTPESSPDPEGVIDRPQRPYQEERQGKPEQSSLVKRGQEAELHHPSKRIHQNSSQGLGQDAAGRRSPIESHASLDNDHAKSPFLACPFYKLDSHKHHECLRYGLRRVKDVKQHIYRRHTIPDIYCPLCLETFTTAESRDQHTRELICERQPLGTYNGITEDQKKKLSRSSERGKSVEDQWYDIWDLLFPSTRKPLSPYLGDYIAETMPQLKKFWEERRSDIIEKVGHRENIDAKNLQYIDSLMQDVFAGFVQEASKSTAERAECDMSETPGGAWNTPQSTNGSEACVEDEFVQWEPETLGSPWRLLGGFWDEGPSMLLNAHELAPTIDDMDFSEGLDVGKMLE